MFSSINLLKQDVYINYSIHETTNKVISITSRNILSPVDNSNKTDKGVVWD